MISSQNTIDDAQQRAYISENIQNKGCHIVTVEADDYLPGFAYTIGLHQRFNHPEVICMGLKQDVMCDVLNEVCELVQKGVCFAKGKDYADFLEGYNMQFIEVDKAFYKDYVGLDGWYNGNKFDFPLLQLIWPDMNHKYPWERGFDKEWEFTQVLLDRSPDFKFLEEKNLGVYTTRQCLEGEPIRHVYHDKYGDWQFHANTRPRKKDALWVSLGELVKLDPSLNEIFQLSYGWKASRKNLNSKWTREPYGE